MGSEFPQVIDANMYQLLFYRIINNRKEVEAIKILKFKSHRYDYTGAPI